ncbi:MAG TPA: hypothetical protein VN894_09970 [Polyangiaceae bacterium]|nr:hypothetical protein [Polyangiaceae bacterium]
MATRTVNATRSAHPGMEAIAFRPNPRYCYAQSAGWLLAKWTGSAALEVAGARPASPVHGIARE